MGYKLCNKLFIHCVLSVGGKFICNVCRHLDTGKEPCGVRDLFSLLCDRAQQWLWEAGLQNKHAVDWSLMSFLVWFLRCQISHDCDEHLKFSALKSNVFVVVVLEFFLIVALRALKSLISRYYLLKSSNQQDCLCVSEGKVFPCLPLFGLKKYHPGLKNKSALLFYKLVYSGWKRSLQAICKQTVPKVSAASSSSSSEKCILHILSVSFVNQRMRCWNAPSTVKPLSSVTWLYKA